MDFVERFAQAVSAAWGDQVRGSLEPGKSLVVYPSSTAAEPFGVYFDDNTYSFYTHERGSRIGPEFQSDDVRVIEHCLTLRVGNALRVAQGFEKLALYNTAPIRSGWTMVPSASANNPGFTGIRSDRGVFYPCAGANRWLLAGLSHVVEYSPLDVLECYLRPDAAPLLSEWLQKR